MKRASSGKVEFYRVAITTAISLIEERRERKMHLIDASIEARIEQALEYGDVKKLKELHTALFEMYEPIKKKALIP